MEAVDMVIMTIALLFASSIRMYLPYAPLRDWTSISILALVFGPLMYPYCILTEVYIPFRKSGRALGP